jgi:hypothetical protein
MNPVMDVMTAGKIAQSRLLFPENRGSEKEETWY